VVRGNAHFYFYVPTTIACPLLAIAQTFGTKSFRSAKRSNGAGKTTIVLWQMCRNERVIDWFIAFNDQIGNDWGKKA